MPCDFQSRQILCSSMHTETCGEEAAAAQQIHPARELVRLTLVDLLHQKVPSHSLDRYSHRQSPVRIPTYTALLDNCDNNGQRRSILRPASDMSDS